MRQITSFLAGDFSFKLYDKEVELIEIGLRFENSLAWDDARSAYMAKGDIWLATHQTDKNRNVVFLINKKTRELENFYLKHNMTVEDPDRSFILKILRDHQLISN